MWSRPGHPLSPASTGGKRLIDSACLRCTYQSLSFLPGSNCWTACHGHPTVFMTWPGSPSPLTEWSDRPVGSYSHQHFDLQMTRDNQISPCLTEQSQLRVRRTDPPGSVHVIALSRTLSRHRGLRFWPGVYRSARLFDFNAAAFKLRCEIDLTCCRRNMLVIPPTAPALRLQAKKARREKQYGDNTLVTRIYDVCAGFLWSARNKGASHTDQHESRSPERA